MRHASAVQASCPRAAGIEVLIGTAVNGGVIGPYMKNRSEITRNHPAVDSVSKLKVHSS